MIPPSAMHRSRSLPTICVVFFEHQPIARGATRCATARPSSCGVTGAGSSPPRSLGRWSWRWSGSTPSVSPTERDRARLEADRASRVSDLLIGLLTAPTLIRTPDPKEPTVQNLLDIGAERVAKELAGEPELQARDVHHARPHLPADGTSCESAPAARTGARIGRARSGPKHVPGAEPQRSGRAAARQGNLTEAEPLLRESLAMRRRLLGPKTRTWPSRWSSWRAC